MAEQKDDFASTLDTLEAARNDAEQEYFERLRELEARVGQLAATAKAAEAAAADAATGSGGGPAAQQVDVQVPALDDLPAADQIPWPVGGGVLRRAVNAIVRWALRDYLAALDLRHRAVASALAADREALAATGGALVSATDALVQADAQLRAEALEASRRSEQQARDAFERLREGLNRTVESVDLLAGLAERLRLLDDAKDAEILQRAAHGPLRKMELMFDEFARQQEALLAELVGRRQELDAALEALTADKTD